nr:immunoglobulin light chain junction region [Macaca mulatta]MOX87260.1 immunoglobulin light chain junction region [Macaca mulatta]MOX87969.1 immunoglobulin light chain junction region [Macaca mulatta]MOX88440.1 immunoglobulin light chain junction region [Macaca mulatta]MOX88464.1 immunoglobulin light chain junction region [Macaca mulatta]
CQNYITSPFIF